MKKAMIAVAALAASSAALADGPGWTFVDLGYIRADSVVDEADGFQLRGSYEFATKWHARLAYVDGEDGSVNGDFDGYELIVGAHPAITDNTDLVWEIGLFDFEDDFNNSTDGYILSTGIRSMITDNTELNGMVSFSDGDADSGSISADFSEINLMLGGRYIFSDNASVGVDYTEGGILGDTANFYIRLDF